MKTLSTEAGAAAVAALEREAYVSAMAYTGFRRAMGAWTVTDGAVTRFETGEWADSPSANDPFATVAFLGWLKGTEDGNGTAPTCVMTPEEFAAFLAHPDFVTYGSDESVTAAESFKATWS